MAFLGKTGLILSAGMLLAGGILFSIGASNGGIDQVQAMAENGELSIGGRHLFHSNHTNHSYLVEESVTYVAAEVSRPVAEVANDWGYSENEVVQVLYESDIDGEWLEHGGEIIEIAKKDEIEKLVIDCGTELNIYLVGSDYFQIVQGDSSYKVDGDTIRISQKNKSFGDGCSLYIPADWVGKEIAISIGAGSVYSEALHADRIDISIGTGYMEGGSVTANQLGIEIGSGSLELYELSVKDADMEIGLGRTEIIHGTITGNLELDCGMGGVVMYLTGKESDHNYQVSSTGYLNIGNYNQSGLNANYEINNHASSDFEIKCGLGSIEIYFD